jgi:hypothetical protein
MSGRPRAAFEWVWSIGVLLIAATVGAGEFRHQRIAGADPLSTIRVTLTIGAEGQALEEPVDLHLGLGFPLRLYPLGGTAREPGFAAYAQKSTLAAGTHGLQPGESATFEFRLQSPGDGDADVLRTTPELLRDLTVRDVLRIGFASPAKSAWVLAAYSVEINGRLFASHRGVNIDAMDARRAIEAELLDLSDDYEVEASEAADLAELEARGLASEAEVSRLNELKAALAAKSEPITAAALQSSGALPWFDENHEDFQPVGIKGETIGTLEVGLTTQDGEKSGSKNPLYFWVDGRKYLLTSEVDPLADGRQVQTFQISAAELRANPLHRRRVNEIGIGMVGNDLNKGDEPDRARLARVTVMADGVPIYDSGKTPDDRRTLSNLGFIPPAHRDNAGRVVVNEVKEHQLTLWRSSALLPAGSGPLEQLPEDSPPEPAVLNYIPQENPAESPFLIYGAGDGNDNQRSTPRRRKRKPSPVFNFTINLPAPAPGPALPPRPIQPQPGPNAPVLSNIRINPAIAILRDGDQATVTWQVSGNTLNVSRYRVDLFGVLPHKRVPLIGTPLSTRGGIAPLQAPASGGRSTMQARPPAISVAAIQSQLSGAEASYLYVQPKVTALGADGKALVSGFGSILPLFPAGYASPPSARVVPGPAFIGLPTIPPPAFQVLPAGSTPGPWRAMTTADPNRATTAWSLFGEQDTLPALTFASYVASPGSAATGFPAANTFNLPAYNAAVRPAANGEQIALQYDATIPYPTTLPSPTRGWRLVGHIAFLGGTTPGTALVQTRVRLYSTPANGASQTAYFTMQTVRPISYAKFSSGTTPDPALLIDMPLRFDLMKAGNFPSSTYDASKYSITSLPPGGATGFIANRGITGGDVTLMIAQPAGGSKDAVGVFGLRLVPDNN